jgi:hypothetical protein
VLVWLSEFEKVAEIAIANDLKKRKPTLTRLKALL